MESLKMLTVSRAHHFASPFVASHIVIHPSSRYSNMWYLNLLLTTPERLANTTNSDFWALPFQLEMPNLSFVPQGSFWANRLRFTSPVP